MLGVPARRGAEVLLCHCHRVSDRTVESLVEAGAQKVGHVVRATRAGTDCGGCLPALRDACRALLSERTESSPPLASAVSA